MCELHGRGLVALAYKIKHENLFCGLFGQIHENFPLYSPTLDNINIHHLTVYINPLQTNSQVYAACDQAGYQAD